ncbi:MAG: acyl carrier protein [Eggerthellaceae bacterium]|nr:acyl carrier protein [Eggerthellaceae bacterium]
MDTLTIIRSILSENLGVDPNTIRPKTTFDSLKIDSLDMVELICTLEDKCDIVFGEPEGLETVEDLVKYVDSLR